jgi:hypothetical protein
MSSFMSLPFLSWRVKARRSDPVITDRAQAEPALQGLGTETGR